MLVDLPPYLHAHLFFHRFQTIRTGVACSSSWWPSLRGLAVHHCRSFACNGVRSACSPAPAVKAFHTPAAKGPELKVWSMVSMPALSKQQKQGDGSMPKLVSFSFVGSLPFNILHTRNEDLNGMKLCHNKELNLFRGFLCLISSQAVEQLNLPSLLSFQMAWSCLCCC